MPVLLMVGVPHYQLSWSSCQVSAFCPLITDNYCLSNLLIDKKFIRARPAVRYDCPSGFPPVEPAAYGQQTR